MGFIDKIFKGKEPSWGVHPDDHKRPAADAPLRVLPPPAKVYMPLQQHVGGAARPIVLVGQKVLKGQLLAEPSGNISAPIHAPVSGTVSAIGEVTAPHASGLGFMAITIDNDYEDRWIETEQVTDPLALTPGAKGEVRIARDEPGWVGLSARSGGDLLLVLAESYDPGWRVQVDGRPVELERVNGDFMGCRLGKGDHQIEFRFDPPCLRYGKLLSLLGLALLLLIFMGPSRARPRAVGPVPPPSPAGGGPGGSSGRRG